MTEGVGKGRETRDKKDVERKGKCKVGKMGKKMGETAVVLMLFSETHSLRV